MWLWHFCCLSQFYLTSCFVKSQNQPAKLQANMANHRVEVHVSPAHLAFLIREQVNSTGCLVGLILGEEKEIIKEELTDTDIPRRQKKTVILIRSFQPWPKNTLFKDYQFNLNMEVLNIITDGKVNQMVGWFTFRRQQLQNPVAGTAYPPLTILEKSIHHNFMQLMPTERQQNFLCAIFTSIANLDLQETMDFTTLSSSHNYMFLHAGPGDEDLDRMLPLSVHVRTKDTMADSGQFTKHSSTGSSNNAGSKSSLMSVASTTSQQQQQQRKLMMNDSNKYYTMMPSAISEGSNEMQRIMSPHSGGTASPEWMRCVGSEMVIVNSVKAMCENINARARVLGKDLVAVDNELQELVKRVDNEELVREKLSAAQISEEENMESQTSVGESASSGVVVKEEDVETQLIDFDADTTSSAPVRTASEGSSSSPAPQTDLLADTSSCDMEGLQATPELFSSTLHFEQYQDSDGTSETSGEREPVPPTPPQVINNNNADDTSATVSPSAAPAPSSPVKKSAMEKALETNIEQIVSPSGNTSGRSKGVGAVGVERRVTRQRKH